MIAGVEVLLQICALKVLVGTLNTRDVTMVRLELWV